MEPDSTSRPDWTLVRRACRVWTEDDATTGQLDHETMSQAFKRIYKLVMPTPLETWDDGETIYKKLPAGLVACASYPGNSGIVAWPLLSHGDPVTVVLRSVPIADGAIADGPDGGNRLVHTRVVRWSKETVPDMFAKLLRAQGVRALNQSIFGHDGGGIVVGETFETEDDDRPEHRVTDRTVTWVEGHVPLDGEEALALLRAADDTDEQTKDKEKL